MGKFSRLSWQILVLVVLFVSFVSGRVAKAVTTEVDKNVNVEGLGNVVNVAYSCDGHVGVDLEERLSAPWRKDVRIELSDVVSGKKKCAKKIRVFGLPDCIRILNNWVYVDGCCMKGSARSVDFKFNKEDCCYEAVFFPELDDKFNDCRNLGFGFDMDFFKVKLVLCYKEGCPHSFEEGKISPLKFKVSNKGLNKPKHLSDFNNFKVEAFRNERGSFLKICGIPANVSKITVISVSEEQDVEGKDWVDTISKEEVCRNKENGSFVLNYVPTQASGRKIIHLAFDDEDDYAYEIYSRVVVS